jgi:hypothetical protein
VQTDLLLQATLEEELPVSSTGTLSATLTGRLDVRSTGEIWRRLQVLVTTSANWWASWARSRPAFRPGLASSPNSSAGGTFLALRDRGGQRRPDHRPDRLSDGLIISFQSAMPLRMFGAEIYVARLLGLSMIRELGPLVTAIILAGRSGASLPRNWAP